jgi:hypothetical protein
MVESTSKRSETIPGGRFLMPDKKHARLALSMLSRAKGLSESHRSEVRARAATTIASGVTTNVSGGGGSNTATIKGCGGGGGAGGVINAPGATITGATLTVAHGNGGTTSTAGANGFDGVGNTAAAYYVPSRP